MPKQKSNLWKTAGLVSMISSCLVGGLVGGVFIGLWLDRQLGTMPWFLIIFLFVGLLTGCYGMYKVVQPFLGDDEHDR
ncbi:AtpZ/AtpI family protein [Alkalicoccobacillus plakortidis]|uniref:AtpZ/AtpI family protein n=1 Tax=Alkalicoccobacillus plakortidis TaxID=444060 RepID=A0ABT0XJ76_9BACI|nr:AtpZ/AtpI family protein [Alkalicoccobacillus plakortidis]MCM2675963.1 AtpZ/AtpI family protein [Alkalicoccobacillus plakortidis]